MAEPKTRKKWYARTTYLLLIFASWFVAAGLADVYGFWIWFVWMAFLIAVNGRNPGDKAKPTDLPTTPAPAAVTSEELAAVEPGNALGFFFSGKAKLDALNLQLAQHRTYQTKLDEEMAHYQQLLSDFPDFSAATDNEEQLLVIDGVSLLVGVSVLISGGFAVAG